MTRPDAISIADLAERLAERAKASPAESYTARLVADPARAARKFGEEAVETVIAAMQDDPAGLVAEAADVMYHLLALLIARGIDPCDVMAELSRRTAQSGLAEKASRKAAPEA